MGQPWAPPGPCASGGGSLLQDFHSFRAFADYAACILAGPFETQKPDSCSGPGVGATLWQRRSRLLVPLFVALGCRAISWARTPPQRQAASSLGPARRRGCRPCLVAAGPRCGRGLVGRLFSAGDQRFYWRAASGAGCWRLLDSLAQGVASGRLILGWPFHRDQEIAALLCRAWAAEGLVLRNGCLQAQRKSARSIHPAAASDTVSVALGWWFGDCACMGLGFLAALAGRPLRGLSTTGQVAAAAGAIDCPLPWDLDQAVTAKGLARRAGEAANWTGRHLPNKIALEFREPVTAISTQSS